MCCRRVCIDAGIACDSAWGLSNLFTLCVSRSMSWCCIQRLWSSPGTSSLGAVSGPVVPVLAKYRAFCCPVCHERPCYAGTSAVMLPLCWDVVHDVQQHVVHLGNLWGHRVPCAVCPALPAKPKRKTMLGSSVQVSHTGLGVITGATKVVYRGTLACMASPSCTLEFWLQLQVVGKLPDKSAECVAHLFCPCMWREDASPLWQLLQAVRIAGLPDQPGWLVSSWAAAMGL